MQAILAWTIYYPAMGLIFALQPDQRKSKPLHLVLKSQKTRFSMGMGFVFLFALLATMYMAAAPLMKMMWAEGSTFDHGMVIFFYILLVAATGAALFCWFFDESVEIIKQSSNYLIKGYSSFFGIRWGKKSLVINNFKDLYIHNYLQSKNVAKLSAEKNGKSSHYATRGHWVLSANDTPLEKRAKPQDIELLKIKIENYFKS